MSNLLSRKFLVTILVIVLGFTLVVTGNLSGAEWMTITGSALGLYAGINLASKQTGGGKPT